MRASREDPVSNTEQGDVNIQQKSFPADDQQGCERREGEVACQKLDGTPDIVETPHETPVNETRRKAVQHMHNRVVLLCDYIPVKTMSI